MKLSEFANKFRSRYLWGNILAMIAVVAVLITAVWIGLDIYTKHGEAIVIPDVRHKSMVDARRMLEEKGLKVEVTDTGYVKGLAADCVLEQNPAAGETVKSGHSISIIVNASSTPTITLPDIIQNSSLREATAKLKAMGFKVGMPHFVEGEKDWIYGVTVDGRQVAAGDHISVNKTVVLQVGNGLMAESDSVHYVDYYMENDDEPTEDNGDIDDFVEVP
jgi:beta-lactam-binding protein with PASTA domain